MLAAHIGHCHPSYMIDYTAKIFKLAGQLSSMPSVSLLRFCAASHLS